MEFNACTDQSVLRSQVYMQGNQHKIPEEELERRLAAFPRFDLFAEKMFAEINEKHIGTLVIDVSNNSGGNSKIGDILLSWLKQADQTKRYTSSIRFSSLWQANYPEVAKEYQTAFAEAGEPFVLGKMYDAQWLSSVSHEDTTVDERLRPYFQMNCDERALYKGRVFIIQGVTTYSSAGMFVTTARDNRIGTIIGQCSTYRPCHYGDLLRWELPNTGVCGYLSHKLFFRPDNTRCEETSLVPDRIIDPASDALSGGVGACEKWILEQIGHDI